MKLGLGTVQFGLNYGISNTEGKTSPEEVVKILDTAYKNGVKVIDTASLYGDSEKILGNSINPEHKFCIITKTPKFDEKNLSDSNATELERVFNLSLADLKAQSIYGLLLKESSIEKEGVEKLIAKMNQLKQNGQVGKIGISVYTANEIDLALKKFKSLDIIQLPLNMFDQRLIKTGYLKKLKDHNVEIHVRSAFLQGLIFMNPDSLTDYFDEIKPLLAKLDSETQKFNITRLNAALSFVINLSEVDCVVAGVNNNKQLNELISVALNPSTCLNYNKYSLENPSILDPSRWPK